MNDDNEQSGRNDDPVARDAGNAVRPTAEEIQKANEPVIDVDHQIKQPVPDDFPQSADTYADNGDIVPNEKSPASGETAPIPAKDDSKKKA